MTANAVAHEYTMSVMLDVDPAEAERQVRQALAEEGFGILSEIDVQAKILEKVGEDIGHYRILGACNPPLAHRAIVLDEHIGALLPCNVLVRAANGGTEIAAADPDAMMVLAGDALREVATEAKQGLRRALDALA